MFKLVTVEDTIVVPAHLFGYGKAQAVENIINKQMSDRVIPGVGLVIALWDILSLGDDKLARHSGKATTDCRFRVLVFSPFVGEAIPARIGPSTEAGILSYLHFFNLVWVPNDALPRHCTFDTDDQVWAWRPNVDETEERPEEEEDEEGLGYNDDQNGVVSNFMDGGNETVVRVTSVEYDETTSNIGVNNQPPQAEGANGARVQYGMVIKASMYDDVIEDNQGLGDPAWWYEDEAGEEEQAEGGGQEAQHADGQAYDENEGEGYQEGGEEEWAEDDIVQRDEEFVHEDGRDVAVGEDDEDE